MSGRPVSPPRKKGKDGRYELPPPRQLQRTSEFNPPGRNVLKDKGEDRLREASERAQVAESEGRSTPVLEAVRAELASRELAHRRLLGLVLRHEPAYLAGWVHRDIARRLEQFSRDVTAGKSPRLILQIPPRHGKSVLASQYLPAWHLAHNPRHEVIITSHTATLALKFSRRIRELIRDPKFTATFEWMRLNSDAQSVENWALTQGGGLLAAGVGGGILGSGAHVLVIDDPIKNAEEAQSDAQLDAIWDWYTTTARTRLAPGGGVLVIMQRWGKKDIAGRLIEKGNAGDGELFQVVDYPAVAMRDEEHRKQGEALHPERYSLESLEAIKATLDPWMWMALYQQRPTSDEGTFFKRDMFSYYDPGELPDDLTYYAAWDLAISQRERADWTVGIVAGLDQEGDLWIVDRLRDRWDAAEISDRMLDVWEDRKPDLMGAEQGQIKLALGPYLERAAEERQLWDFVLEELKPGRRDKVLRARSIQGLMRRRKVHFPRTAPWMTGAGGLVSEMLDFPNGEHDDQVDAMAYLGLMLKDMAFIKQSRESKAGSPDPRMKGWHSELVRQLREGASSAVRGWRAA